MDWPKAKAGLIGRFERGLEMGQTDAPPPLPPPEAWPGCVPPEQAHGHTACWLSRYGIGLQGVSMVEELAAAAATNPEVARWVRSVQAWLACLEAPGWQRKSVEELHRMATRRWRGPEHAEERRQLVAEFEGGLAGPSLSHTDWAVWLPNADGTVVIYDGTGPARRVAEEEARLCAIKR